MVNPHRNVKVGVGYIRGRLRATLPALPTGGLPALQAGVWVARTHLEGRFAYHVDTGWHRWTGKVWVESKDEAEQYEVEAYAYTWADELEATGGEAEAAVLRTLGRSREKATFWRGARNCLQAPKPPDFPYIAYQNGILNLETRELEPHSHTRWVTRLLPCEHTPATEDHRKTLDAWFGGILSEEGINTLIEQLALSFTGQSGKYTPLVALVGSSRTGKTTILRLIAAVLGEQAIRGTHGWLKEQDRTHDDTLYTAITRQVNAILLDEWAGKVDRHRLFSLTSGDDLEARAAYGRGLVRGKISATLWGASVKPPAIETGDGLEGRLAVIMTKGKPEKREAFIPDGVRDALAALAGAQAGEIWAQIKAGDYRPNHGEYAAYEAVLEDADPVSHYLKSAEALETLEGVQTQEVAEKVVEATDCQVRPRKLSSLMKALGWTYDPEYDPESKGTKRRWRPTEALRAQAEEEPEPRDDVGAAPDAIDTRDLGEKERWCDQCYRSISWAFRQRLCEPGCDCKCHGHT
ncbi:hypothetical protein NKDENANG_02453 [Candidatus Entotheonellaceae bacterium PAL068K]